MIVIAAVVMIGRGGRKRSSRLSDAADVLCRIEICSARGGAGRFRAAAGPAIANGGKTETSLRVEIPVRDSDVQLPPVGFFVSDRDGVMLPRPVPAASFALTGGDASFGRDEEVVAFRRIEPVVEKKFQTVAAVNIGGCRTEGFHAGFVCGKKKTDVIAAVEDLDRRIVFRIRQPG